ncbi:FAD-dependent monooxygenase [Streptomyces sioyaensis]|uniref:FAD-dependent monooxygenase n=1 Tax=Streptomyces sioyaensis TaxID=67364 RepID=UPI001F3C3C61|nr:FAD-dependent monooxygenase [Streptomyces sioyaensis]
MSRPVDLLYVNGAQQARMELTLPPEVPYRFAALPQNDTERILEEVLVRGGGRIERGTELVGFAQDADEVRAELGLPSGARERISAGYLLGCDGAPSIVRKVLGFGFEGAALPEEYMLGDVEVDWELPPGDRPPHQGPAPGDRAPDCGGLRFDLTAFPSRLFDLLRGQEHTVLLYADHPEQLAPYGELVASARSAAHGQLDAWVIVAPHTATDGLLLPVVRDALDEFRQRYGAAGGAGFVIRPDGYLGLRSSQVSGPEVVAYLAATFRT